MQATVDHADAASCSTSYGIGDFMERRFQAFVSSTFQDLKGARHEVSEALLRTGCFPAGMELFPAADQAQFDFIKSVIDESDLYILISAGRYGSIEPATGKSYTELEYDYAVSRGVPIIRLLHKEPFKTLPGELIELSESGRKRLERFRNKLIANRLVRFWSEPKELGIEVFAAIREIQKEKHLDGWVRWREIKDSLVTAEMESLAEQVRLLRELVRLSSSEGSQKEDTFSVCIGYYERSMDLNGGGSYVASRVARQYLFTFVYEVMDFFDAHEEVLSAPLALISNSAVMKVRQLFGARFHPIDHRSDYLHGALERFGIVRIFKPGDSGEERVVVERGWADWLRKTRNIRDLTG
jgi:Domain of unknown function (DUF4062)